MMVDSGKKCEPICEDPLTPTRRPLGDYINEYNRIYTQILSLEYQIDMLEKNRQRLKTTAFDQQIHQLGIDLCMRKSEIEPITLLICEVVSRLAPTDDRDYIIELIFLRRSTREIAMNHGASDSCVSLAVSRCNKLQVPNDVVEKYGEVLTK